MAAYVTITMPNGSHVVKEFRVGDSPTQKYQGAKPHMIQQVQLDCDELAYAIDVLGAADVKKRVVVYFGDEARRIFFNW